MDTPSNDLQSTDMTHLFYLTGGSDPPFPFSLFAPSFLSLVFVAPIRLISLRCLCRALAWWAGRPVAFRARSLAPLLYSFLGLRFAGSLGRRGGGDASNMYSKKKNIYRPKRDKEKEMKGKEGREGGRGRKEGRKEGRKAGRQEGRKAGRQAGRKEGRKEGTKQGRNEGAKQGRQGRKQTRKERSKQASRQGKARQGKAKQGKARQGRQGKARQGKQSRQAKQIKAEQGKARQGKAKQSKQSKAKPSQAKPRQGKARQGKQSRQAKQIKAEQGKASKQASKAARKQASKPGIPNSSELGKLFFCRCEACAQSLAPSREAVETAAAVLQRQDRWQAGHARHELEKGKTNETPLAEKQELQRHPHPLNHGFEGGLKNVTYIFRHTPRKMQLNPPQIPQLRCMKGWRGSKNVT